MQHRDIVTLKKILVAINEATEILENVSKDDFLKNITQKLAMAMSIIRVGELVKNLTDEFRKQNSQVPWRDITGFRDIAAHKYDIVDMNEVYKTIKDDLPELKAQIEKILVNEF